MTIKTSKKLDTLLNKLFNVANEEDRFDEVFDQVKKISEHCDDGRGEINSIRQAYAILQPILNKASKIKKDVYLISADEYDIQFLMVNNLKSITIKLQDLINTMPQALVQITNNEVLQLEKQLAAHQRLERRHRADRAVGRQDQFNNYENTIKNIERQLKAARQEQAKYSKLVPFL